MKAIILFLFLILSSSVVFGAVCIPYFSIQTNEDLQGGNATTRYVQLSRTPYENVIFNFTKIDGADYGYCYQETANISTECGGNDNGTYWVNGTDNQTLIDGNYSSGYYGSNSLFVNYTKIDGAFNTSYLKWVHQDSLITVEENSTIPASCWAQDPLQFWFDIYGDAGGEADFGSYIYAYCYNSTDWVTVADTWDTKCLYGNNFYDEAMFWHKEEGFELNLTLAGLSVWSGTVMNETLTQTPDLSIFLNALDIDNCNCGGCVSNETGCYAPFDFTFGVGNSLNYDTDLDLAVVKSGGGGGGGEVSGGGRDGDITIIDVERNNTVIIDFGLPLLGFSIIAPPSEVTKNVLIKNEGYLDLERADIGVSGGASEYLNVTFCNIDFERCSYKVDLDSGNSGFLVVQGTFPEDYEGHTDGIITIFTDYDDFELITKIDELPGSFLTNPLIYFFEEQGLSKGVAIFLTFASLLGTLTAFVYALSTGGIL